MYEASKEMEMTACKEEEAISKKQIHIQGTHHRYEIKKLVNRFAEPKVRKEVESWTLPLPNETYFLEETQKKLVQQLYDSLSYAEKKALALALTPEVELARRQIEKKIQRYKQQDIDKGRPITEAFVSLADVIYKLYDCQLKCGYCNCLVYLIYEHVREKEQWTLDRIDNDLPHNRENVVISCLACNLKRRRTSQKAFLFTKKMQLVKIGVSEESG